VPNNPEEFRLPPSYREVADLVTAAIDEGLYPYGTQLPSATELAALYDVSVATIHRAMKLLAERGIIQGRQGLGRFVTRRTAG
jgi:GntR family transcriptional regulator